MFIKSLRYKFDLFFFSEMESNISTIVLYLKQFKSILDNLVQIALQNDIATEKNVKLNPVKSALHLENDLSLVGFAISSATLCLNQDMR